MLIAAIAVLSLAILAQLPFHRENGIVFKQIQQLQSPLGRVLVYLGFAKNPAADFPASFFATFVNVRCSATLVGPDALLTARHCAKGSQSVTVQVNGTDITGWCAVHDSADVALCQLTSPVTGIVFDVIESNAASAAVNKPIHLTGWDDPPAIPIVDWMRRLWWVVGLGTSFREAMGMVTTSTSVLSATAVAANGSAFQFVDGDSGGAGYAESGTARTIIGVNQCGGPACPGAAPPGANVLTNLTDAAIAGWILSWANDNGAQVCGVTSATGCRQ
ncbi:MAG TPA: trypsin-like serine protease [Vicinamibacterales bacterium]|nr:trypsin-like serine protease [Vicinamibacterales bacterium]